MATARRLSTFLRWSVRLVAVAYPLALLVVIALFRWVGEGWWIATIALYLPRLGFALPLPFLLLALLIARDFRWLLSPLLAAAIIVGPLMGLHLGHPRLGTPGTPRLTVLQLNMGFGHGGRPPVIALIRDVGADIVTLEAVSGNFELLRAEMTEYKFFRDGDLAIGSRFPIDQLVVGAPVVEDGVTHDAMYMRARVMTPSGPIRVYAVHPTSPHSTFDEIRGEGLRHEIRSGQILGDEARVEMIKNTNERLAQLGAAAADAQTSPDPVLIGGDTNMPELSRAFARLFGDYQDAFAEVGRGFGYSYPDDKHPWMRIDRILAGPRFRILSAVTLKRKIYKHRAVVADVELPPAAGF